MADSRTCPTSSRSHVQHPTEINGNGDGFLPYMRNEQLVRPWAIPGTPGLEHRIGGLEKSDVTGNVDYSPANHQHMTNIRRRKVAGIAKYIPEQTGRRTGVGRSAGGELGRHVWCRPHGRAQGTARQGNRSRTAICGTSIRSRGTSVRS